MRMPWEQAYDFPIFFLLFEHMISDTFVPGSLLSILSPTRIYYLTRLSFTFPARWSKFGTRKYSDFSSDLQNLQIDENNKRYYLACPYLRNVFIHIFILLCDRLNFKISVLIVMGKLRGSI
jgi:hypothetical protein